MARARSDIARLKAAGLYSGKISTRKPTKYQKSLIRKFDAFLKGNAKVVTVKSRSEASNFDQFWHVRRKVVVFAKPGDTVKYSRKTGAITRTRGRSTFTIMPGGAKPDDQNRQAYIIYENGEVTRFGTDEELAELQKAYTKEQWKDIEFRFQWSEPDKQPFAREIKHRSPPRKVRKRKLKNKNRHQGRH